MDIFEPALQKKALRALKKADPQLASVIRRVGKFTLKRGRGRFEMLVGSIISQQISTSAARSIHRRLKAQFSGKVTPEKLQALSDETLRSCGISPQKLRYLRDLTDNVVSKTVRLRSIGKKDDEDVITELIQIKGIGRWTAQMFLMFSLGRPDVFPVDDLGIQNGIAKIYDFGERPTKQECEAIAAAWSPYATFASWYCWQSLDLPDE